MQSAVLHITPAYKPAWIYGGPTLSVSRLCESQQLIDGVEVTVFTTSANGGEELEVDIGVPQEMDGVQVTYFKRWTGDHTHLSPALLWQLWRNVKQFDFVHIHSWWNLVTMPAILICWLRGVRPVLSPRGMLSSYGRGQSKGGIKHLFQMVLGNRLLRHTVLHATATQEVEEAKMLIPDWPHFVLPNNIAFPRDLDPSPPAEAEKMQFFFLSRIHHKKGLELLLEALAQLSFPWELKLAGDGNDSYIQELQSRSQELGISEQLHWMGWLEAPQKYELLAQANLMVLPSLNENFANVVLESLAVGTPVLVSDRVGMSEFVAKHDLGWVCPRTLTDLTKTLEAAKQDVAKRERIRQTAPELVRQQFEPVQLAQQYLTQYEQWLCKT